MTLRSCPNCPVSVLRHLPSASSGAVVDYYRCESCGSVFKLAKDSPDGPLVPVTINR